MNEEGERERVHKMEIIEKKSRRNEMWASQLTSSHHCIVSQRDIVMQKHDRTSSKRILLVDWTSLSMIVIIEKRHTLSNVVDRTKTDDYSFRTEINMI